MAKGKSKSTETNYVCKVQGEMKWMGHDGDEFYLVDDINQAEKFTYKYAHEIKASKWGGKDWQVELPDKDPPFTMQA